MREDIQQVLLQISENNDDTATRDHAALELGQEMTELQNSVAQLTLMMHSVRKQNQIMEGFYFSTMYTREGNISDVEAGTFEWLVKTEPQRSYLYR